MILLKFSINYWHTNQQNSPLTVPLTLAQLTQICSLSFHESTKKGMKHKQPVKKHKTTAKIITSPPTLYFTVV